MVSGIQTDDLGIARTILYQNLWCDGYDDWIFLYFKCFPKSPGPYLEFLSLF